MNKTVEFLPFSFALVYYADDILQIKCNATASPENLSGLVTQRFSQLALRENPNTL